MELVHKRCCGLDVHKSSITACVIIAEPDRKRIKQARSFGAMTCDLLALVDWLQELGVTHVAMEATGVYRKPVWNVLEGQFVEILSVNAQHVKAVPGRKTDQKDAEWLADLLQYGLLRGSFIPPAPIRELRDLTRTRVNLVEEVNRITNRIQKVLEDANLKLSSVASDTVGASGLAILAAIIAGQENAEELANMARGKLRNKIPELVMALQGRITSHHRFMLQHLLIHLHFLQSQIGQLEAEINRKLKEESEQVDRPCTIPGVDRITACALIAEIGLDMDRFPSERHLASWAGLCPGNSESAGKRLSGATRKGSPSLCRSLCQVAWVVSRSKHTYFAALFKRIASRRGLKKAIIAVAHSMLVTVYFILKRRENYRELGFDYFDRQNTERIKRSLVKRLERVGNIVVPTPALRDA